MAIPAEYIRELIQRNDIYDVVSRSVSLKRAGRLYKGLCPFHSERTPSFTLYPETQSFYCFGCGKGGDVITFTMEINHISYLEAVRSLAESCGMPLPSEDDGIARNKTRILQMNKAAARHFFDNLNSEQGKKARQYLRKRRLRDKTIVNFGLGYSADSWNDLTNYLKSLNFTEDEMVGGYLAHRGKKGGVYDVFRGRIMFPIIDLRGNVIAFGGRKMEDDAPGPKYLNSSDTPVFKKSNGLFALNLAKRSESKTFILCEGYMDVIAMHRAGFDAAVATLGTALTQSQAKLISDYADKVIIAYDSDEAGQKATRRAMEIFSKENINVEILDMKGAKDPDEYIKKYGRQKFEMLIEGAESALDFSISKLKGRYNISTAQGKADYLNRACELLAETADPILADVYCTRLREETDTDKDVLKLQLERAKKRIGRKRAFERENALNKEGVAQSIKPDFNNKYNNLNRTFLQQQIMCALLKDNINYKYVSENLTSENFTDGNMREAYIAFKNLMDMGENRDYGNLTYYLSEDCKSEMAMILARNADMKIGEKDLEMYVQNLLTSKLTRAEMGDSTVEELAKRVQQMKDIKK